MSIEEVESAILEMQGGWRCPKDTARRICQFAMAAGSVLIWWKAAQCFGINDSITGMVILSASNLDKHSDAHAEQKICHRTSLPSESVFADDETHSW